MRLINADSLRAKMGNLAGFDVLGRCIDEEPTACDIEQIKNEIEEASNSCNNVIAKGCYLFCLGVIDKYIK